MKYCNTSYLLSLYNIQVYELEYFAALSATDVHYSTARGKINQISQRTPKREINSKSEIFNYMHFNVIKSL